MDNKALLLLLVPCLFSAALCSGSYYDSSSENREASTNLSDVRYLLWTRSNLDDFYLLKLDDLTNLQQSPFDGLRKTYFIMHGFSSNGYGGWVVDAKTNILKAVDANVISIDYEKLVDTVNYDLAVKNLYNVANQTASFIDWLTTSSPLQTSNIHISGHSLGGQGAGLIGGYLKTGRLGRITGMDPAGPEFYEKGTEARLDKSDAVFVDIIHTNSCPLLTACVGYYEPLGHVDFYPNGGEHQTGCTLPGNITGDNWIDLFTSCSHSRSHDLWIESILAGSGTPGATELTFVSWPCDSWETYQEGGCSNCGQGCLEMGFNVGTSLEGIYYLSTYGKSPFAMGDIQQ